MIDRPINLLKHLCPVLALLLISACAADPTQGYSSDSTFTSAYTTVAVPILDNETFQRGIEFELTDALIKEIQRRTPYRVVDQSNADTVITGRVVRAELDHLSRSRLTGLSEELILSVTIDFEWRDLRSNRTLLERKSFTGHGLFLPSRPSHEPMDIGRYAAVEELARDVVHEMRSAW